MNCDMERKKKWEEKRDAVESDLEYMLYDDMAKQNPPPELPKPSLLEEYNKLKQKSNHQFNPCHLKLHLYLQDKNKLTNYNHNHNRTQSGIFDSPVSFAKSSQSALTDTYFTKED